MTQATPLAPVADVTIDVFLQRILACSRELAETIARRSTDRHYAVRALIIRQGETPDQAFLLLLGRAEGLAYGLDGQAVLLHDFGPGDVFGAIGDSEDAGWADIVAVEHVRAAVFAAKDFLSLIETQGCVAIVVSRALLRQLHATAMRVKEQTTLSASGRVYVELLRLAGSNDGNVIEPAPVFSELAVRVHTTRETVSRAINALVRRGIVRRYRAGLIIVAPHRLQELVI